ncbi:hypothetical protein ACLBKU_07290 [Erythrobacter sp. NE805]|uniref:hypothetical protein n=1 Tax=Erythrobacter sp. NE805 TaxID=3389875 RepID=UPI00396B1306
MMMSAAQNQKEEEGGEVHRPWLMIALVVLSMLGLGAATLLLPHDTYVRYQQLTSTLQFRTVWSYERLAFDQTPIDIAVIGNSRLQAGVSGPLLAQRLSERLGRKVHVANLSIPQEGRSAHYVLARELFRHHPEVKLVLISAIEAMPRESHPAFRNIAEAPDILDAPMLINLAWLDDLAYIPYRQMSLFVQSRLPQVFGVGTFHRKDYAGTNFDSTKSFISPTAGLVDRDTTHTAGELRPKAQARVRGITPPVLPVALANQEFAVERQYTKAIAELAEANGTALGFVYLPIFENPERLRQESYYLAAGPVLSATCIAGHAEFFSDYGHLNRTGAVAVTRMLGDTLVQLGWGRTDKNAFLAHAETSLCTQKRSPPSAS